MANLETKTRGARRAVLVSAKTMPCPNKLGPQLAPNGAACRQKALVGACATPTVARWRACRKTRHMAPTDAKQRHRATDSAKKRQVMSRSDRARH
jgi:hypothetical protein